MSSDSRLPKATSGNDAQDAGSSAEVDPSVEAVEAELIEEIDRSTGGKVDRDVIGKAVHEVLVRRSELYAGPLPHPKHFEQFERTLPGAAGQILDMAEREQEHRHEWERRYLVFDGLQGLLGQTFGFLGLVALIGSALTALWMGSELIASLLVGASVVGVVTAIIRGRPMRVPQQDDIDAASNKTARDAERSFGPPRGRKR